MSNHKHQFLNNNDLTTERRFGKKTKKTTPSRSRRATASCQPNKKPAAVPLDATKGHDQSNFSESSKKVAHGSAVSSNKSPNKCTDLDNNKQIHPILPFAKKTRSKNALPPRCSSKMRLSELPMGTAPGNKTPCRPLHFDKSERKEDWKCWKLLIESEATRYAVSNPVETTDTESSTSASGNVINNGDLNEELYSSQNQSKC